MVKEWPQELHQQDLLYTQFRKVVIWQGDEKAQKKFQEVSEAYDTLKDSQKRQLYDQVGPEGMDGAGGFGGQGGFGVSSSCSVACVNISLPGISNRQRQQHTA